MKKLLIAAALAVAGLAGQNAAATPICEFWSPTDGGPRHGYALYDNRGVFGYFRKVYVGGADLYGADTENGDICDLAASAYAQFPFYLGFSWVGSPPILIMASGGARLHIWSLPWSCFYGVCLLGGGVTTVAYGPGLPRVHVRPWLFTMIYF